MALSQEDKERWQVAFTSGVAAAIGVDASDVIINTVETALILRDDDGTGIDVTYTVLATEYDVQGLVIKIRSREVTDAEVTALQAVGYPKAECSAEVMTTVIEPPTSTPSTQPTAKPTDKATPKPTTKPTNKPTTKPTDEPTDEPTEVPTKAPYTRVPTAVPTTSEPTEFPTHVPYSVKPTNSPFTHKPTEQPTEQPSKTRRTRTPTRAPFTPRPTTEQPTDSPTRMVRTRRPTAEPTTSEPTVPEPTEEPTEQPTRMVRTRRPTAEPTVPEPTAPPPTEEPTAPPPTEEPTEQPTRMVRTRRPTAEPTVPEPTEQPTRMVRTRRPTAEPTEVVPTELPTESPAFEPTEQPTETRKTRKPSYQPTANDLVCGGKQLGLVYVVGLQRIDTVSLAQAQEPEFSAAIIHAVAESVDVADDECEIQSIAAAKYSNSRGDAVDVIFSIYAPEACVGDIDDILKGRTTTDNIVNELIAVGYPATASSEAILIDYSPSATPTAAPTAALVEVTVTQVVTGVNCASIAKEPKFDTAFDAGIKTGMNQPTCGVEIDNIDPAVGGVGCDVTYTAICHAGTDADEVKAAALAQTTADACTASIEANGYPTGVCGEVMVFVDHTPTQSPTTPYMVVFEAAQALQGTCVDPSITGTPEFVTSFEKTVATCLRVDASDVSIQGVKMSDLNPPSIIVDYVVVAPDSSVASVTIINRLNQDCIPSGQFTALLDDEGFSGCESTTDAYIVDRSPTEVPTMSPTPKVYVLQAWHQIYGVDLENATDPSFAQGFIDFVTYVASEGPGSANVTLINIYDPRITPPDIPPPTAEPTEAPVGDDVVPAPGTDDAAPSEKIRVINRAQPGVVAKNNDSNIVVEYTVLSTSMTDTAIENNINTAIAAGVFTQALRDIGFESASSTTPVRVLVLNPTQEPTQTPTSSPTKMSDAEYAGIAVGAFFGVGALTLYSYYMYVHNCLRTPITSS